MIKKKIGVNLIATRHLDEFNRFKDKKIIDYIEITIDNFLFCDPLSIKKMVNNIPISFHIMNSKFIERDLDELKIISNKIKNFIDVLNPIYVSDHLLKFSHNGLNLPFLSEVNYIKDKDLIIERAIIWQNLLNSKIYFENYSSISSIGLHQPAFLVELVDKSDCGILFDISNAYIASKNLNKDTSMWDQVIEISKHFHVGGFSTFGDSGIYIDSHDRPIDIEAKKWLSEISRKIETLTIEYDHEIDYSLWEKDIKDIRKLMRNINETKSLTES